MTHTQYIYLGQLQPLWETTIPDMPLKIGKTNNANAREYQLSRTKSPFSMKFIRLWEIPSDKVMLEESYLHEFFDDLRIEGTEYFENNGTLSTKLDMMMTRFGYQQILNIDELVKESMAAPKNKNGPSQACVDFWTSFDKKDMPQHIKPVGAISGWNRGVSAGKGFHWEYCTWGRGKTGGGAGLWTNGNRQSRIDILFSDNMKEKLRKEFPSIVFTDTKSRIYVPVDGDRSMDDGSELHIKLIDTMSKFYDIINPIIKDLP